MTRPALAAVARARRSRGSAIDPDVFVAGIEPCPPLTGGSVPDAGEGAVGPEQSMPRDLADEAEFRRRLEVDPVRLDALLGLAMCLLRRGNAVSAQLPLLRATAVAPDCAAAWYGLGVTLVEVEDFTGGRDAFAEAQRIEPHCFEHALRRGGAALLAGAAESELARLEAASAIDPLDVVSLTARGALLERLGRLSEAVDVLEAATLLSPGAPEPAIELGNALIRTDRDVASERALGRAIVLRPDYWMLRNNRGVILMRLHRFVEARAEFEALLAEHTGQPGLLCNLSTALTALGLQQDSADTARIAIALDAGSHLAHRALLNALAYQDGTDGQAMLRAARAASDCIARVPSAEMPTTAARPRDPARRLRVGLLSTMLKTHPVGWLTVAGIEHLARDQFEVVCIAQPETDDPITRRFRAASAEWHDIEAGSAAALAEQVRALDIDVLLELSGYGDRGVMSACAHRGAPVQVKWVGMQNHSTGLPEMDWFITDRWETPPGYERHYSERLLRLPDGYVCYSPPAYAPDVAPLPAGVSGQVTFGCFNNLAKITERVIATWSLILGLCPDARLILKTHQFADPGVQARLQGQFAAHGVAPSRVELRAGSPHRILLRQYGDIDIVLDPFPYTGGLTTCEALWMGVPTVTIAGETFSSRHAASHLSNVGLADWVAPDLDAYVNIAVQRAGALTELSALRANLRAQVRASPLCDAARFGRSLGCALRHAWVAWCDAAATSS